MQNLQFITHYTEQYGYADAARLALEGGCRWIQLRMKDASPEEWMRTGAEVEALCRRYGATFVLDDRVEVATTGLACATRVHLGESVHAQSTQTRRLSGARPQRRRVRPTLHLEGADVAMPHGERITSVAARSVLPRRKKSSPRPSAWKGIAGSWTA